MCMGKQTRYFREKRLSNGWTKWVWRTDNIHKSTAYYSLVFRLSSAPSYVSIEPLLSRYSAVSGWKWLKWETPYKLYGGVCFKITRSGSSGRDLSFFIQLKKKFCPKCFDPYPKSCAFAMRFCSTKYGLIISSSRRAIRDNRYCFQNTSSIQVLEFRHSIHDHVTCTSTWACYYL